MPWIKAHVRVVTSKNKLEASPLDGRFSFIAGVKGAQVEEIYDLSKPFRGYVPCSDSKDNIICR